MGVPFAVHLRITPLCIFVYANELISLKKRHYIGMICSNLTMMNGPHLAMVHDCHLNKIYYATVIYRMSPIVTIIHDFTIPYVKYNHNN